MQFGMLYAVYFEFWFARSVQEPNEYIYNLS